VVSDNVRDVINCYKSNHSPVQVAMEFGKIVFKVVVYENKYVSFRLILGMMKFLSFKN